MAQIDLLNNKIKNVRAIVYKIENGEKLFLLTQEFDGYFTLPGGCKDLEDLDLLSALKRELREEIGLSEKSYSLERITDEREYANLYTDQNSERFGKNTIIYPFLVAYNGSELIRVDDIKDALWMNESDAMKALNASHMRDTLQLGIKNLTQDV